MRINAKANDHGTAMPAKQKFQLLALALFTVFCVALIVKLFNLPNSNQDSTLRTISSLNLDRANSLPEKPVRLEDVFPDKTDQLCKLYNCFDIYKCGINNDEWNNVKIFLYPLHQFVDENREKITSPISREFYELYSAIASSSFYTSDPSRACLFVPPIDLLNQNKVDRNKASRLLATLKHWNHGKNHLIFNMLPGTAPEFSTSLDIPHGKAIVAGGGFSHWTYRTKFDVSIPVYSPVANQRSSYPADDAYRKWTLVSAQTNIHSDYRQTLIDIAASEPGVLVLEKCRDAPEGVPISSVRCKADQQESYPEILDHGVFCLILPTTHLGQSVLSDALSSGCIPVFACDTYVLPFSEVLDWTQASVVVREDLLPDVMSILRRLSYWEIQRKRNQASFFWRKYFKSVTAITHTTLQIINDRIFPHSARTYEQWNFDATANSGVQSPLSMPIISPKEIGFTAIILTYDRVESLFRLIVELDKVQTLSMILVIWNNQQKTFPPRDKWPIIDHEWKVIQTSENKLSNRFLPFDEIKTEAVLSIDDDIVMLTSDEIEFGFQVWREFPDRIVGFPPRLHLWTDDHKLRYESEWKNNISIVLTGASFYHNYYNYLYTYKMPGNIKDWVDDHMNCEDIAMNFVVANHTGKAPIKVTPRKKFKCSECTTGGSLSLDETHMVERTTCINHFSEAYGMLPLKSINFRADPVLFKDDFPQKLKEFPDIGNL